MNDTCMKIEHLSEAFGEQRYWFALFTKSRYERQVHAQLEKKHTESFLPIRYIKKYWSDRTVIIPEPLFKSYLFVKTSIPNATEILKTQGVVRFVSSGSKPISIREDIILSLRHIVQTQIRLDPFPYLKKGDRVFVRSGIFKGTEGYIIRKNDEKCRLVISIDALMASVSIELDSGLVEKI